MTEDYPTPDGGVQDPDATEPPDHNAPEPVDPDEEDGDDTGEFNPFPDEDDGDEDDG